MVLSHKDTSFKTPTETILAYNHIGEYDVPDVLTWADTDRDLTAWTGNDIQRDAIATTYRMEEAVINTKDTSLIETWRKLQTSDHFYYMCTKWSNDGDVHAYFSPYQSPYDAYIAFMNALSDLQLRVQYATDERAKKIRKVAGGKREVSVQKKVLNETLTQKTTATSEPLIARSDESAAATTSWWSSIATKIPFFNNPAKK
jgi:alpha-amylase/alpha-mannosidase (GH57 family)